MSSRPVLRVVGDLDVLRATPPAKQPKAKNGTRECPSWEHQGNRQVAIESFWDRKAGVIRKTCGQCRHRRKVARRRTHAGPARRARLEADQFWNEQAERHK